jgi:hypothetical protein
MIFNLFGDKCRSNFGIKIIEIIGYLLPNTEGINCGVAAKSW